MKHSNRQLAKTFNRMNRISFCGLNERWLLKQVRLHELYYDKLNYVFPSTTNYVYRAVINNSNTPFSLITRIRYNPDPKYISRANLVGQAIGYYSMGTTCNDGIDIAIIETCHDKLSKTEQREFELTVSQWKNIKIIPVQLACYDKNTHQAGTDLTRWCSELKNGKKEEFTKRGRYRKWLLGMKFISEQFSKQNITCDMDYLISAYYASNILAGTEIKGIIYPSVQYLYKGFNIALHPDVIEQGYILLEKVMHYKVQFDKRNFRKYPKITLLQETTQFRGDCIIWSNNINN
jgi:hypothetical protein